MNMIDLIPEHYEDLFKIKMTSDPLKVSYPDFRVIMEKSTGFTFLNDAGKVIGCTYFNNYTPGLDIIIHAFVDKEYQGTRWLSSEMLKRIFDYPFGILDVQRVSTYSYIGLTDKLVDPFVMGLGFKIEGVIRRGMFYYGDYFDITLFGLLPEELRIRKEE